ncbi:MAG TPA: hypothetical protein HA370_03545 [Nanoarchaeota archaeon]|nr:hypothetical protein [Nanoarchaeota archaeon]
MKKVIAILLLLFLVGCSAPKVELEAVTNDSIIEELPEVIETEEISAPYYDFYEGDTKEILGKSITLEKIYLNPQIDITVGDTETGIKETKTEEIIEDVKIMIWEIQDNYQEEKYVTLKIEKLELGENEYIIQKNEKRTIGTKDILLEESRTNGYIQVTVFNKGTSIGDTESVKHGESVEINEVTVTNLKNYYKIEQYAWVTIE